MGGFAAEPGTVLEEVVVTALPYRPRHTGSMALNILPFEKLNVNLNGRYVGKRYDSLSNVDVPDYTVYNLAAAYSPLKWLQVFGRIDNLTNKKYQAIYQYGEPGIETSPIHGRHGGFAGRRK